MMSTSMAVGGETQQGEVATVHHALPRSKSPSRRLRRCCCNACRTRRSTKGLPGDVIGYSYRVINGCIVTGHLFDSYGQALAALIHRPTWWNREFEVERVWLFKNGGTNYELIRGGRWVNEWEANYGVHKHEPREKIRCMS